MEGGPQSGTSFCSRSGQRQSRIFQESLSKMRILHVKFVDTKDICGIVNFVEREALGAEIRSDSRVVSQAARRKE
jgi:hypothetical protein